MLNWLIWTLMIPVKGECPDKGRTNKKRTDPVNQEQPVKQEETRKINEKIRMYTFFDNFCRIGCFKHNYGDRNFWCIGSCELGTAFSGDSLCLPYLCDSHHGMILFYTPRGFLCFADSRFFHMCLRVWECKASRRH